MAPGTDLSTESRTEPSVTMTSSSRVFVVLNPMAGSSAADTIRAALEKYFGGHDTHLEIYETTGQEGRLGPMVAETARKGFDLMIAAGGDGTIAEVADGLVGTGIPLGIIPVGTANVLARELGLPLDVDAAVSLLAGPHATRTLDAMRLDDRHFVLQIGIGIDALMIRDTSRTVKRRFGRIAYLWTACTRVVGFQPRRFLLDIDGKRHKLRASQVLLANGGAFGDPEYRWGPGIRLDDGVIDVCVAYARTPWHYCGLLWDVFRRQPHRNRLVRYFKAHKTIDVVTRKPLPVQADGEIVGETPIRVEVVPAAVDVVVPRSE